MGSKNQEDVLLNASVRSTDPNVNSCNPHKVYRGNVRGNIDRQNWYSISCGKGGEAHLGYGVYAEPTAEVMREVAGVDARAEYLTGYEQLAEHVKAGRPVITWFSHLSDQEVVQEVDSDGSLYYLYPGEHVRVIDGVKTENGRVLFHYVDLLPIHSGSQGWEEAERVIPNWLEVFGGMSVVTYP